MVSAAFFILVLLSYVLFFGHLTWLRMGVPFYEASSAVQSRTSIWRRWQRRRAQAVGRERPARGWLDVILGGCPGLRADTRAMVAKDIRLFWRDTTQWGQTLMLFGLWGVYMINLRTFSHQLNHPFWLHVVSYLNLLVCSLNLATLTTRFVFPQFSLEGKRLWIVGLAPLGLARIIRAKFWLASGASLLVTLGLTSFSCHVLRLTWPRGLFFGSAITIMTFALTGLAVGLGVLYPNFREENPGKIVNGFGGTFCLVASFFYILGSVLLLTVGSPWIHGPEGAFSWVLAGWGGFALLSVAVGWLPMRLAGWRLKHFEL
jgi:ABC-2 type transport system permease protein